MGRTCNFHCQLRSIVGPGRHILDLPQRQHSVDYPPKNDVFPVQEVAFCGRNEELPLYGQSTFCRRRSKRLTWQPFVLAPELASNVHESKIRGSKGASKSLPSIKVLGQYVSLGSFRPMRPRINQGDVLHVKTYGKLIAID